MGENPIESNLENRFLILTQREAAKWFAKLGCGQDLFRVTGDHPRMKWPSPLDCALVAGEGLSFCIAKYLSVAGIRNNCYLVPFLLSELGGLSLEGKVLNIISLSGDRKQTWTAAAKASRSARQVNVISLNKAALDAASEYYSRGVSIEGISPDDSYIDDGFLPVVGTVALHCWVNLVFFGRDMRYVACDYMKKIGVRTIFSAQFINNFKDAERVVFLVPDEFSFCCGDLSRRFLEIGRSDFVAAGFFDFFHGVYQRIANNDVRTLFIFVTKKGESIDSGLIRLIGSNKNSISKFPLASRDWINCATECICLSVALGYIESYLGWGEDEVEIAKAWREYAGKVIG